MKKEESEKKAFLTAVILILLAASGFLLVGRWPRKETLQGEMPPWRPGTPLPKERVKIGVIYTTDAAVEKNGYSYAHDVGIQKMRKKLELRDDQIIRRSDVSDLNRAAAEQAMRECILEGANVIIATSLFYADACEKLAREYPGVVFAQTSGVKNNGVNFTDYDGRIYQARYLAGVVAGLRTGTGKVGHVASMGRENSKVTGAISAFALGVERVNPSARVYVKVIHRWFDPEGEALAARALIEAGCDVITHDSDTPSPLIEARKAGVWGIGYNTGISPAASSTVITSITLEWEVYYIQLIQSVIDGSFTAEPYFGGLKEGLVDLAPLNERLVPPGTAGEAAKARAEIESGVNGVFDGLMRTSDGRVVGMEGATLSDAAIREKMNWYYHNVIELH
ncbi:MAG: BMP family ABC transporter substrate-binding protein [Synergistaceae bacterium]|nr:BMP family ABC transporter substrate-binding protein [Synergistaceae bacterium]